MIKKIFILLAAFFFVAENSHAVLKEKDLARTLGVLRAELEKDWERQQAFIQLYEQQGIQQHQQLVNYMNQCEQIGLMLYSQSTENTFDMAYACSQATALYYNTNSGGIHNVPYDRVIKRMKMEIERMEALIKSLKSIPPVIQDNTHSIDANDSILISAIDSLSNKVDSFRHAGVTKAPAQTKYYDDSSEPLVLSGQQLKDRGVCLNLAEKMHRNMRKFLTNFESERKYYESVREKVDMLHVFAQSRYKVLQDNIFKNGTDNYFTLLLNLPSQTSNIRYSISNKYNSFDDKDATYSEWRGLSLLFILAFVFLWLPVSLLISYIIMRWLTPRKWHTEEYKYKRRMLGNILGVVIFGLIVMSVRVSYERNSFMMGSRYIIDQCWLMGAVFLSLYIRLKGEQMIRGAKVYFPTILMAFIIILFRIILIPNSVVNLVCPPLLLGFAIWQMTEARRHSHVLPALDNAYSSVATGIIFICCLMSWIGYSLMAIQMLIWWSFQLVAIITISCLYDVLKIAEIRLVAKRINPNLVKRHFAGEKTDKEMRTLLNNMESGKYINQTWLFDFAQRAVLPILGVASILYAIGSSAEVFDLQGLLIHAFMYNFLDIEEVIQLSLLKLCVVAAMYFLFRWGNYTLRSFYIHYRMKLFKNNTNINFTLAKNVIAILMWGMYIIISLIILKVPRSGISIITAGLATGMGFAMKDLLENFFYGISLMTGRIRVGDYIQCDGIIGRVTSITYQSTQIDTLDGCVIAFLNSALFTKHFKNLTQTDDYQITKLPVGVAYGTSIESVRKAVIPALEEDCARNLDAFGRERSHKKPLLDPNKKVTVRFADFGASSVDLHVCVWSRVEEYPWLLPHLREVIYNALNQAGIEIPFPQCDVHMKG